MSSQNASFPRPYDPPLPKPYDPPLPKPYDPPLPKPIGAATEATTDAAIEAEFNAFTINQIRFAKHRVGDHPLRGSETSFDAATSSGKVKDGQPVQGVRIRRLGEQVEFSVIELAGDTYVWDTLAMSSASFTGFVAAMRDVLHGGA